MLAHLKRFFMQILWRRKRKAARKLMLMIWYVKPSCRPHTANSGTKIHFLNLDDATLEAVKEGLADLK